MICYLIRHGKDDDSVRGGWSSAPLTADGIKQVQQLSAEILLSDDMDIGVIYTSDLLRAKQTAQMISSVIAVPVIEMPEFREVNNGILAGMKNQIRYGSVLRLFIRRMHGSFSPGRNPILGK